MLIAHISDFHVFSDRPETALVRLDAEAAARKVVADMAAFSPALDAVFFTGDITDGGSEDDYRLLKDILSPLTVPVLVVPGNHDKRSALRWAFEADLPFGGGAFLNYEVRIDAMRVLALDTLIEGRTEGALEAESLQWLEQRLSEPHGGPTSILLHHPPFPSGIVSLDRMALVEGREQFAAMVRRCEVPPFIFAGHIHRPYQCIWNGAFCAVGGSPAFQIALDLVEKPEEPAPVDEPYGYFILRFDSRAGLTVHRRFVVK